jgi:hypothetical protein
LCDGREGVKDVYVTWEICEKEVYVMMDVKKNVYVTWEICEKEVYVMMDVKKMFM